MSENPLKIFTERYLSDFNPKEPFVWKMRLPYSHFLELERLVANSGEETFACPVAAFVYLAEWYKWRYTGQGHGSIALRHTSERLRQLYIDAGVDIERYVVVNPETGRHSWLYSIFVLGGLPIHQEVNRNKASRFLRSICRMYHGGAGEITDEIADAGRAEAFRKALQPEGSLRGFVKELIDGGLPFASEDEKNPELPIQQFRQMMIDANNRVRSDKFDIRHIMVTPPDSDRMSRRIELHLLPEISGTGLAQYLMYDRVLLWKFTNPREIEWIEIFVRFMRGDRCLEETKGLATFTNTGLETRGFVGWNLGDAITVRDIPVRDFDRIELWARDNSGRENIIQKREEENVMQLYHTDNYCEWSSFTNSQRTTAVIWSEPWHIKECPAGLDSLRRFVNRSREIGDKVWHFSLIPDELTLLDANDNPTTFYNHQGYDRLVGRGHYDTIAYNERGEVCFVETDEDGDEEETFLPLIFSKDDLQIIRRSNDENEEDTEIATEIFEWKSGGRFVEWTDDDEPLPGRIRVRCQVRGRQLVRDFVYLGGDVSRNLSRHIVKYPGGEQVDEIREDEKPLTPTIRVEVKLTNGICCLDVWRPINCKEINIGDHNWFRESVDNLSVPAIVCRQIWVGMFGQYGYRRYLCRPLTKIFSILSGNDKVARLSDGIPIAANQLDPSAPNDLNVILARKYNPQSDNAEWIFWNYVGDCEKATEYKSEIAVNSILFPDRRSINNPIQIYSPIFGSYNAFKYKPISKKIKLLECFEKGAEYGEYYFAFIPLRNITPEIFQSEIVDKLKEKYGSPLPMNQIVELQRAIMELNLNHPEDYEI